MHADNCSIDDWNEALLEELLPIQLAAPVLLACDDETVRAAGQRLGLSPALALESLLAAVKAAHHVVNHTGLGDLSRASGRFRIASCPRGTPPFFAVLCVVVLAASRMCPDGDRATSAYYPILRDLLGLTKEQGAIEGFSDVELLFPLLREWLHVDLKCARGHLALPDQPTPRFVGYPISQTVFRQRDREVLTTFFSERIARPHEGIDNLRLLRRWGGRHQLTRHALDMVMGDAFADRVRAAISGAYRSWDGSILEGDGRRSWVARLTLQTNPARILVSSASKDELHLIWRDWSALLYAGGVAELPWSALDAAATTPLTIAIDGSDDTMQIPTLGMSVLFQVREDQASGWSGLSRVRSVDDGAAWVLTREPVLISRHQASITETAGLPAPWKLLFGVRGDLLPMELRSLADAEAAPISVEGGLAVERRTYLVGGGPRLVAGKLDEDVPLAVSVDGVGVGMLYSGRGITLPAETPARHQVVVADRLYVCDYEVVSKPGSSPQYGELRYDLDHPSALMRGATADRQANARTVCGAAVEPVHAQCVPIMRSSSQPVLTISSSGVGAWHHLTARPPWLNFPELKHTAVRWEIADDDTAWVICPNIMQVIQWRLIQLSHLDAAAADVVLMVAEHAAVEARDGDDRVARAAWASLWELAIEEASD